ncbi:MAG TPA: hypothetical protein VKZ95_09225 [Sphingobacteriaceae bacterium]|nr:hypothetical protein [Sphingobacteriaceae bacterium]
MDIRIFPGFQMPPEPVMECFGTNPSLLGAFTCINNKQISVDGDCDVFIPVFPIMGREDSLFINKLMGPESPFNSNHVHFFNLKRQVTALDNNHVNWTRSLSYLPLDETKEWFNADSVIYFRKILEPGEWWYENRFDTLLSVMFQKKDRGFVNIIFFYKERSQFNVPALFNLLKGNIVYRD